MTIRELHPMHVDHLTLDTFAVTSATRRGLRHYVHIHVPTGLMTCSCEAGRLGRNEHCRHRTAVIDHLHAVTGYNMRPAKNVA